MKTIIAVPNYILFLGSFALKSPS